MVRLLVQWYVLFSSFTRLRVRIFFKILKLLKEEFTSQMDIAGNKNNRSYWYAWRCYFYWIFLNILKGRSEGKSQK